jgi:hypothetical protein
MPTKNKPKRFNRFRSWRVARRKMKLVKLSEGGGRNRKPRLKDKEAVVSDNSLDLVVP